MLFSPSGLTAGFSLIEVVVTTTIIGVVMALLVVAYPVTRTHQHLLLAQQQLEAALQDAQQRAINEERDEQCIARFAQEPKRCSDIGVLVEKNALIVFADTVGERFQFDQGDFKLQETLLSEGVQATRKTTFVFQAVPPTTTMHVDGSASEGQVRLQAGKQTLTLNVRAYGKVEAQ